MSRSRKWWHKMNHDRVMRDQFVWALPDRAMGLLMRIECMTGSTDEGCSSGFVCSEDGAKVSKDDFVFLFSRGDEKRAAEIEADFKLLVRVKQLCPRVLDGGKIKLLNWEQDQDMPASADGDRKRSAADERLFAEAQGWGDELARFSARLGGRRAFSADELLSFIKARRNGYAKTNVRFLEFLIESGVCARSADGLVALASLAPPAPAVVGFSGSGAACSSVAGAGEKISPDGKFPQEKDPETERESREVRHSSNQLDSAGGGAGGASEAGYGSCQGRTAFCRPETERASGSPPDASDSAAPNGGCRLVEPGDAYRCEDALRGSIEVLEQAPGWAASRYGDRPCSATVLRSRWRDLRAAVGPVEAERIWRVCLDQAITDRLERAGWKSWVAIFLKRVERQMEFMQPMEGGAN